MYKFQNNTGMDNLGNILWENVGCLFIIYIICYFSMWKGVQTSGKVDFFFIKYFFKLKFSYFFVILKVVWFTALFPYVVLFILSINALFLPGSLKGMEYYLTPNISTIKNPLVIYLNIYIFNLKSKTKNK